VSASEITINKKPNEIRIGDIGFARTNGLMGKLIRAGEWLKWRECEFNHTFTVVAAGNTYDEIWIVQAELRGVSLRRLSEILPNASEIHLVAPPEGADPKKIALFSLAQLGSPYGLMSITCLALDITTPDWFIAFRRKNTWICSALSAEACRYAGWYHDFPDIYIVTPTGLWKAFQDRK
jgi:hypothetical protein